MASSDEGMADLLTTAAVAFFRLPLGGAICSIL